MAPLVLPDWPVLDGIFGQAALLVLRIALLPFIAAISYELQRLSARFCQTGPLRVFLYAGFLFQKISTREPDDAQVEIAIAAMQAASWRADQLEVGTETPTVAADDAPLLLFPSFSDFTAALPRLR